MNKQNKTILIGWIGMVPLAVMIIFVLLQNWGILEAHAAPVEYFTVEETEAVNEADFDANSAMPCVDAESFRRWHEAYEPETSQEARNDGSGTSDEGNGTEPDAAGLPETGAATVETAGPPLYRIAGQEIDEGIQIKLYQHLQAAGIEWWYDGALCQMFQESHGQQYAENPNGLDKGIYQYRITYWNWNDGDIFDVDAQMRRYASEMSARFNSGLSANEAISRHKTSDYVTTIDWTYVGHVKQWLNQMERIN